jgi:MFS family permease
MLAAPLALALAGAVQMLEVGDEGTVVEKKKFALPRGPLALLGALGFLGSMAEGSIADWSGVFLKEHFHATDGLAPLALSSFSVMMLGARLLGDRLKARHGARLLVTNGAMLAGAGLFFGVLSPNAYFALGGFATAGLGLSLVFPFVFSAAGSQGPMALAGVASMAYSGSLMGPPVIGAIAQGLGMQAGSACWRWRSRSSPTARACCAKFAAIAACGGGSNPRGCIHEVGWAPRAHAEGRGMLDSAWAGNLPTLPAPASG